MLTPVDHLIASKLGLGTFVRYCDDILVYARDRDRLAVAWDHVRARCDALRLRLHPRKCRLHRTTEPVAFLGFVLQRRERAVAVRLRSENVRRFRTRTRRALELLSHRQLEADEVVARIRAWVAHARHGHTSCLRRSVLSDLF